LLDFRCSDQVTRNIPAAGAAIFYPDFLLEPVAKILKHGQQFSEFDCSYIFFRPAQSFASQFHLLLDVFFLPAFNLSPFFNFKLDDFAKSQNFDFCSL